MYLEVYPDIIFVLNFILDYIILTILKVVNRKKSTVKRRILAAVFGAFIAALVGLLPWMNVFIRFIIINVVTSMVMLLLAFGKLSISDLMKQMTTLFLITYSIGGLINSIYYNTRIRVKLVPIGKTVIFSNIPAKYIIVIALLLFPTIIFLLWLYRIFHSNDREVYDLELIFHNTRIKSKGFYDSGNCLYDPLFKKPVIIVEEILLEELLSPELLNEYEAVKAGIETNRAEAFDGNGICTPTLGLRIIPYQSIGKQHGIMLGLILDKVIIYKKTEEICIEKVTAAISDIKLSTKSKYHVILHKDLI